MPDVQGRWCDPAGDGEGVSDVVTEFGHRWRTTSLCALWVAITALGAISFAIGWRSPLWMLGYIVFTVGVISHLRMRSVEKRRR